MGSSVMFGKTQILLLEKVLLSSSGIGHQLRMVRNLIVGAFARFRVKRRAAALVWLLLQQRLSVKVC